MLHVHIDTASVEFIQHLAKPFLFRLRAFGSFYPADEVILLIGRTLRIGLHQAMIFQGLLDKDRQGIRGRLSLEGSAGIVRSVWERLTCWLSLP